MNRWRFIGAWHWAGYAAFVIVFAIACVMLSQWQLARRAETVEANNKVTSNYESTPVRLSSLLPQLDSPVGPHEWHQVRVEGTYLVDQQILVRTRPLNGNPGFEVLVPLQTSEGTVFVIDRGWVPVGQGQDLPDSVPAAPSGPVSVVARLKPGEPRIPGRTAPEGQIATIELSDIAALLDLPTYTGGYGLMASETPPAATNPAALPKPPIDEGAHLSYAFQWIVFGVLGFVALAWAIRQEYRTVNADHPDEQRRAKKRELHKARKPLSDADIEDDIVDRSVSRSASSSASG